MRQSSTAAGITPLVVTGSMTKAKACLLIHRTHTGCAAAHRPVEAIMYGEDVSPSLGMHVLDTHARMCVMCMRVMSACACTRAVMQVASQLACSLQLAVACDKGQVQATIHAD